jgi:RNA polymerase sigma-70 factor (ECF subfamily)
MMGRSQPVAAAMPDSELASQLEQHRRYLLRVARLQLRDDAAAEDVVQETLLAALAGTGFSGRSSLRTWLTGILKHKIVDAIRRRQRDAIPVSALGGEDAEADRDDFEGLFRDGGWDAAPAAWGDPDASLQRQQFFDVLEFCLERLPPNTARVFMMREVLELESAEICKELAITANNLWVMLYRARMMLRQCLDAHWFADAPR